VLLVNIICIWLATPRQALLRRLMVTAFLAKISAAAIYNLLIFRYYDYAADAVRYWDQGARISESFTRTGHWKMLYPMWSNNLLFTMSAATAYLGASFMVGTILFAVCGYWGQFLLFRAFCIAYPEADVHLPAVLLFLTPSVLFWSSAVGKDSVILLTLGAAAYGLASLIAGHNRLGIFSLAAGLVGTTALRPHVGAILVVAFMVTYFMTHLPGGAKGWAMKTVTVPLLLVSTVSIVKQAQTFVALDDLSHASIVIGRVGRNNLSGYSAMTAEQSTASRAVFAPFLFFRPFPWEVRSIQGAAAALEGVVLLVVCWRHRRRLGALARGWREHKFTLFLLLFLVQFAIIFSAAISNFGLLARERVMALPFFLMILCVPPRKKRVAHAWLERVSEFPMAVSE
jgi:hypothetical protein